ncbi:carbohydrate ABC transporter permease [Thermus islandicus]|uniref:carbohydrate ABC transporter permease n=1 Tax=Thermus islandicus TaxID=540988 RepID=UPI0003B43A18|nr:carbohydrate ABC transporter permease [Thermus islandicus]
MKLWTKLWDAVVFLLLLLGGLTMIVPFLWMVSTSLKAPGTVFDLPVQLWPSELHWENYSRVLTTVPFGRWYLNSLILALGLTLLNLTSGAMAGYAFARFRFRGQALLFLLFLATLMIPVHVLIIPLFILMRNLGWVDTYYALILPGLFDAFAIFLMRQHFLQLPRELEEAAIVDGATPWQIYWKVALPLAAPALATLGTFTFLAGWNSFLWPLIVTNSLEMRPLTVGLAVFQGQFSTEWTVLMAGLTLGTLPPILVFLLAQRYFIQGLTLGSLKG